MSNQGEHDSQDRGWGATKPPEDRGRRLATFPRVGQGQVPEEVRVSVDEYSGAKYVSVRLWRAGTGGFWPTNKGCSIRRGELAGMIVALEQADRELNRTSTTPSRGRQQGQRQERQAEVIGRLAENRGGFSRGFDEFDPE